MANTPPSIGYIDAVTQKLIENKFDYVFLSATNTSINLPELIAQTNPITFIYLGTTNTVLRDYNNIDVFTLNPSESLILLPNKVLNRWDVIQSSSTVPITNNFFKVGGNSGLTNPALFGTNDAVDINIINNNNVVASVKNDQLNMRESLTVGDTVSVPNLSAICIKQDFNLDANAGSSVYGLKYYSASSNNAFYMGYSIDNRYTIYAQNAGLFYKLFSLDNLGNALFLNLPLAPLVPYLATATGNKEGWMATASQTFAGSFAEAPWQNNEGIFWAPVSQGDYFQIQSLNNRTVVRQFGINLRNGSPNCFDVVISASNDGTVFVTLGNTGTFSQGDVFYKSVSENVTGYEYYRFTCTWASLSGAGIRFAQLFGGYDITNV